MILTVVRSDGSQQRYELDDVVVHEDVGIIFSCHDPKTSRAVTVHPLQAAVSNGPFFGLGHTPFMVKERK